MGKEHKLSTRKTLLAGASVLAGVAGLFGGAQAHAQEGATDEAIIVTGSRIARQDYIANSPIVTVNADDIAATGVTTLDTLLNEMPQFVPGINMTSNNPSNGGQANLQLRGLGPNRTLVLMNGRRVVPSNATGTVDVNILPAQLIKGIEVITGGASATYGSDAIAGVVNFQLRNDFEGFEATGSWGQTERQDGESQSISIAGGGSLGDRGHAVFMVSYNNRGDIYNAARPFSSISGASAASPLGNTIFDANNLPTQASVSLAIPGAIRTETFGFNDNNTLFSYTARRDFVSPGGIDYDGFAQAGPFFNPNFAYNTGPLNLLTLPQTRYNAFAHVDYDINDNVQFYTDFLFTQYQSYQELAASPAAGSTTGFRVPVTNPFISPELATILATRPIAGGTILLDKRFVALGPRRGAELYDVYQFTVGFTGDIGIMDWTYDVYGQFGRVDRTTTQTGNVSRSAVQSLLNAADGGASLCAGGFDWFGQTTLSDACKAFIGRTSKNLQINEQRNIEATIQGRLFDLPAGEARFALGTSYREDTFELLPDQSLSAPLTVQSPGCVIAAPVAGFPCLAGNDIAGFNPSAPLRGAADVVEVFGEVLIPLIHDLPLAEEVNLSLAARRSDYSTVGAVSTYKADVDWTMLDGVRFRGGYQQAVRAPSVGELFAPQLLNFPNVGNPNTAGVSNFSGDPCDIRSAYRSTNGAGANLAAPTNAQVRALCIAQGVPAAVVDTYTFTNQQVPGLTGGNPLLTEETATSYSVGLVLSPNIDNPWFSHLSASIDYYNIEVTDAIGTVDANLMLQACYNAPAAPFNSTYSAGNFFCGLFGRNPLNGNVVNAVSTNQNLATLVRSGVDFQIDWGFDVGPGRLDLSFVGSWLENAEFQSLPGGPFRQQTGTVSNAISSGAAGGAFPEWKCLASADFSVGPGMVGVRWQHIGEMTNFNVATDPIPAIGYFDVLGRWDINDNLTLRANINNVMDELPPTYAPAVQANTDPSTYDVLGRRFTIGFTAKF